MAFFSKRAPQVAPDLVALRGREQELLARQRALEAEHLETSDIERSDQLLHQINELNAQIGVLRQRIENFPN